MSGELLQHAFNPATNMNPIEAILLGVVQGLTEFLPISSSAHIRVVPALFHWSDPGAAYTAVIQLGSVIAVIAYFAKDLMNITTGSVQALKEKNYDSLDLRMAGAIVVGTIPVCVLGLLFKRMIEAPDSPLRSFYVVGGAAIFMGFFLLAAERFGTHKRKIDSINGRDGFLIGLGQAMALVPGCSRSGSTLTVAMFLNLSRADAARFSFLLGIPAITISGLVELKEMIEAGMNAAAMTDVVIGFVVSLIVSYASIAWLLKYLQHHSTWVFVIYRFIFGIVTIALTSACWIH